MTPKKIVESSFRDPSGFLFYEGEKLLRQVNQCYQEDYDHLTRSGLFDKLCNKGLLIPHKEVDNHKGLDSETYKVIEPEKISFISYPYEWSFSQLKDAALTTLEIQKIAMEHGMTLKDASTYNIQFHKGKPVLIDTLSFKIYQEGKPWEAYRQFCQHFLAPLALMSHTDIRLNQLLKIYLDGIPLDLVCKLLPIKTKLNFSLLMHLHLHAKAQQKYEHKGSAARDIKITKSNQIALIQSLRSTVKNFRINRQKTEWGDYYTFTNYSDRSFINKKEIISGFVESINPYTVWDLGANTGEFTQIGSQHGAECVAFDIDPLAVDSNYNYIRKQHIENVLPLVMDLTNPTPSIGWNNEERMGFKLRSLPDAVFALALIHHLAISNNLPFEKIARFLSELSKNLIIEFVPKSDSQVKKLLISRKDIFKDYKEETFDREFEVFYNIRAKEKVIDSERIIYRMERK
ncbi:MAG: class I SAM-dependent methyltransferase [Bacteroidetes bacterium]|nr:class I SAM-dependent methyltransferase [Bacteroidota bacterium]